VAVNTDVEYILSLRASGLGDLLTAVPALRAVRAAHPDARHVLATHAGLQEIAGVLGAVDVVVPAAVGADARPTPVPLFDAVDVAVNLHGCGPESHRLLLAGGPRRLVAYAQPELGVAGPVWDPDEHEVARWCRLVADAGMVVDPDDLELTAPAGPVPPGVRGATVLHPGAGALARQWPIDRWIALAAAEAADGHRVVVTVGPGEATLGGAIRAHVPEVTVVDSSRDVGLLLRVVEGARALVCGDTGIAHVATAVRTPSVVLFGPEPPSRWGPPPDRPWHVALWAGRGGDPHATRPDPGLLEIEVLDVLLALRHLRAEYGALPGTPTVTSCAS
jgi:ADP-heptose:LPS heptosyltransferase